MIYLTSLKEAMKDFIRVNFKGFSYNGGQYCCDLDELFFKKEAIETDELYLYYLKILKLMGLIYTLFVGIILVV